MSLMLDVFFKDELFKEPENSMYFLLTANGLFQIKKNLFFTSSTQIFVPSGKDKLLFGLQPHENEIIVHLPKKIPSNLINQTLGFFSTISSKYKDAEAIVLLYWHEKDENYFLICPEQKVFSGHISEYHVGKNPENTLRVGTIHSHGKASAYHSCVDDKDEEHDDGIHITIGNVNNMPTFACSVMSDGIRKEIDLVSISETRPTEAFPEIWLQNVDHITNVREQRRLFQRHSPQSYEYSLKNKNTN